MRARGGSLAAALSVAVAVLAAPGAATAAADWEWSLSPYVWGSAVTMDLEVDDEPVLNTDLSFSDILDKTEAAIMLHFEGRNGRGGFFVDSLYLTAENKQTMEPLPLPGGTDVHADLGMLILEGGGVWRPGGEEYGLDFIFGVRLLQMDVEVELDVPEPINEEVTLETDENWVDGIVGARYSRPFAKRWFFAIRGDLGLGDTDLTWNAFGTMGVRLGETGRYNALFGYRHLDMDFEDDDGDATIEADVTVSGPFAALMFKW